MKDVLLSTLLKILNVMMKEFNYYHVLLLECNREETILLCVHQQIYGSCIVLHLLTMFSL